MAYRLQRLKRIAEVVPGLGAESRVVDVGSGPGALIPHLQVPFTVNLVPHYACATCLSIALTSMCNTCAQALPILCSSILQKTLHHLHATAICALQEQGVQDILAVEVSPAMVAAVRQNFPSTAASEGNTPQVRTWLGDVQSLPAYQVRFGPKPSVSHGVHPCDSLACTHDACVSMFPGSDFEHGVIKKQYMEVNQNDENHKKGGKWKFPKK